MYCNHCRLSIPDHSTVCPYCKAAQITTYHGKPNNNREYVGRKNNAQPDSSYHGNINPNHAKEHVGKKNSRQADTTYRGGVNRNYAREEVGSKQTAHTDTTYRGGVNRNHAREEVGSKKTASTDTAYRGGVNQNYAREEVGRNKTQSHTSRHGSADNKSARTDFENRKPDETPRTGSTVPPSTPRPDPKPDFHQDYYQEPWYERLCNGFRQLNLPVKAGIFLALILVFCNIMEQRDQSHKAADQLNQSQFAVTETYPIETQSAAVSATNQPQSAAEYLMESRDQGPCKKLIGNVGILFIFVDDLESSWSQQDINTFLSEAEAKLDWLVGEADYWFSSLSIKTGYQQCFVNSDIDSDNKMNHYYPMMDSLGINGYNANETLCTMLGTDQAFPVFVANKKGRAAAMVSNSYEYVFLFENAHALCHEMLHVFGAADFYYTDAMEDMSDLHLVNSIMTDSVNGTVDPLTAYLVGWLDVLTDGSKAFLSSISGMTKEDLLEAGRKNSITGYGTREVDGTYYEGYMLNGLYHGQGTLWWPDGNIYAGNFDNHYMSGYGVFYWNNGDVYEGEFLDNLFHGKGKITFANGSVQSGTWKNGEFIG